MISSDLDFSFGDFYDGTRYRYSLEMNVLPWKHLGFGVDYSFNQVALPTRSSETHLSAVNMKWNFHPDLIWSHLVQYDSVSEFIGFNSRIQWEYRPGSRVFVVFLQDFDKEHSSYVLQRSEVTLKLGAAFRL